MDEDELAARLAEVDFRSEVDLAVLVVDVTAYEFNPADDRALNDAVLAHAQQQRPEWLDGNTFADGRVIIALDPRNRFLGTYGGEDVKLSDSGFSDVQDAMREPARAYDWEGALVTGAQEYAKLLGRPWWQSTAGIVGVLAALATAGVTALGLLWGRATAHRRVTENRPHWAQVLAEREHTEAAARTLPTDSAYAEAALASHRLYLDGVSTAEELHQQIPEHLPWSWGLRGPQRKTARDFERTVRELDDLDDDIVSANNLLHRTGDWRAAWDLELEPLRDSVEGVEQALMQSDGDTAEKSEDELAAEDELRALSSHIQQEMGTLTTRLERDEVTPDQALERLDELTGALSGLAVALRDLRIDRIAESTEEKELMLEAVTDDEGSEDYAMSLRGRRHEMLVTGHGTESMAARNTFWHISPMLWLNDWSTESHDSLETHRNPPSSSSGTSSTSGFSSSSFSGAGSSSRF